MTDTDRCEPPPEWEDETPPEDWGDECASCPFCGSVEIRPWRDDETSNHMMWCYTCGADGPPGDDDAAAEERWNRRVAPVTPPAVVAALVEALEGLMDVQTFSVGWDNGVTDATGTINEGAHFHALSMDRARAALALFRGEVGQ